MWGQTRWPKKLGALLAGGLLVFNTAAVFADPIELSLDDSVTMALKNNPSIKMALADKDKANWAINEAKAGKGVSIDFTHSDSRLHSEAAGTYNSFSNTASLSLPLYTGGKLEGQIDQAKLSAKVSDLALSQTMQEVKLNATTGYYDILEARNMLTVDRESVESLTGHLKNVQAQYDVGTVAKSDLLRSEVELANAQQTLFKAQNTYDLAVTAFKNVLELPFDSQIILKEDLKYEKYDLTLADAVQHGLEHRPEMVQAQLNVDIAKESVKIAKSGKLPTVALSASNGWNDTTYPGADNNNWSVGVSAKFNVFDSGLTKSQVKEANASVDKAVATGQQTRDTVISDVQSAYLSLREAEKRIGTSKVTVEKATEDFKIAQVRYSAGVGTNIDVLDAQVSLTEAKTNYVQALYDYNSSRAKLDKAMGIAVQ